MPCYQTSNKTNSDLDSEYLFNLSLTFVDLDPIIYSSQVHYPHFPMKIFTSKFVKPISVTTPMNTDAISLILDTKILLEEY